MSRPCIVVGGGPAGLAAAIETARAGVPTTLFEEGPTLAAKASRARRERLLAEVSQLEPRIDVHLNTAVLAATSDRRLLWGREAGTCATSAEVLILATGARDQFALFPGRSLPGVVSAGTADISPGARVVIAGAGRRLLFAARRVREAGGNLIAILAADSPESYPQLSKHDPDAPEAEQEWAIVRRSHVPCFFRHVIIDADDRDGVKTVTHAFQGLGSPVGFPNTIEFDLLVLAYSAVPNLELARMAGCTIVRSASGMPVLQVSELGESFVPGILGAGEVIGGYHFVDPEWTGRIAGVTAAERLGTCTSESADNRRAFVREKIERESTLQTLRADAPVGWWIRHPPPQDATHLCSCEKISIGQVRAAVLAGADTISEIKYRTRLGMGACQGRECEEICAEYLREILPLFATTLDTLSFRPPARPVTLGALARMRDEP